MAFEHAPVTKGLMIGIALTSVAAGIFDVKHYLHLQLVPHISKHHQYWRLFTHHLACPSSSDLLLTELILYNAAVHIERAFGSAKFASFFLLALVLNTITTFLAQLILHLFSVLGLITNHIPPGLTADVFSILYQYARLVPSAYEFKVFGVSLSDKVWVYAIALQIALTNAPASTFTACVGLSTGYIYRSDVFQLKGWRVPHRFVAFARRWIEPLLGTESVQRRSTRVFPELDARTRGRPNDMAMQDEVITTARPRPETTGTSRPMRRGQPAATEIADPDQSSRGTTGVMRQWVNELAGAARPGAGGQGTVRVPHNDEIQTLTAMFPDVPRDVVLGVLQRSPDIEVAAETLLNPSR